MANPRWPGRWLGSREAHGCKPRLPAVTWCGLIRRIDALSTHYLIDRDTGVHVMVVQDGAIRALCGTPLSSAVHPSETIPSGRHLCLECREAGRDPASVP